MADVKISALPAATTPLDGTELAPIVQSGTTKRVTVANLTVGRALTASSLTLTTPLSASNGGTGQSSYATGDLLYASDATTLSKLADVATGNALISGGVGTAPSWGKIGLTTHVSGTLPVANGGTGLTSLTAGYIPYGNGTGAFGSSAGLFWDAANSRLGIGTSSPVAKLSVAGTMNISDGSYITFGNSAEAGWNGVSGASGYMFAMTNGSEKLRLDASGNLGLGVTPSAWLSSWKSIDVASGGASLYGGLAIAGITNNAYLDSGVAWRYKSSYGAARYDLSSTGAHAWYQAASGTAGSAISFTQAMTLDASGYLLVGVTSSSTNSYTEIKYTTSIKGARYINASSSNSTVIDFVANSAQVGYISTSGTTTTYSTTSDERLKNNIKPSMSAIQSIIDLPIDQFDWKSTGEHQDFGGVAQKLIKVIPEMVFVPREENEMMGVDWSKAVPRIVKAFQELAAKVSALEAKQ